MRKASVKLFEREQIAEELARKFYKFQGYDVSRIENPRYMHESQHPQEQTCIAMAYHAIAYFTKEL